MASREDLERQLEQLDQAFQAQQIDEASYQQQRHQLASWLEQVRQTEAPAGSDFFSTGGGAPPTSQGVQLNQSLATPIAPHQSGMMIRDRYRIEGMIGEGGMGVVYRVHDQLRNRILAMKLLHPNFPAEAQQQLAAELSMQERIRHKGVVRTYDLDVDPESGRYFYTMEYVDGPSLEEHLAAAKQDGKIPPMSASEAGQLLSQLAAALHTAHSEGIVHRDLKPQNILLPKKGGVKILDFGIAKELSDQAQHTGYTGTPIYMAPEQLRGGGSVTPAADVYSVGVMLYQFLTGQLFYGRMPGPSEWLQDQGIEPDFSVDVDDVVFQALDFSPRKRFQSILELSEAFQRAIGTSPMPAPRSVSWAEAAESASKPKKKKRKKPRPPVSEPKASPSAPRIQGKAPVSFGPRDESLHNIARERSIVVEDNKPKKKKFRLLRILLLIFFVIPMGSAFVLGIIGYIVVKNKTASSSSSPTDTTHAGNNGDDNIPIPPPMIDLQQVNKAFRTTQIPTHLKTRYLRSSLLKNRAWMQAFEKKVNEIYLEQQAISLHARRLLKKVTILGYIDNNRIYGYQRSSDTLVFKIVQEKSVSTSLAALKALMRRIKKPKKRYNDVGSWLDDGPKGNTGSSAKDRLKALQRYRAQMKSPMPYRLEDGMGWVYTRDTLPSTAPYHALARHAFLPGYTTSRTRIPVILRMRGIYRNTSAFNLRRVRHNSFVKRISAKRERFHRTRARTRIRRSRRSRGGKW